MARDRKGTVELQIAAALKKSGCTNLDQQAKALGVRRSTAWTIVKGKHKLGRLNARTTERILANPDTPPAVRDIVRQYLNQKI